MANFMVCQIYLYIFLKKIKMTELETFTNTVDFLKSRYGIVKQTIADEIGVNRNTFNKALGGQRISKCSEYTELIRAHYADLLKDESKMPPEKKISNLEAWDIGLKKIDQVLQELKELKELIKKE